MAILKGLIAMLRLESMAALKDKDAQKRAIIGTVISDLLIDGKDPSDNVGLDKAFATLKQYRKALDKGGNMKPYIDVLEPLLPAQLTREELAEIVVEQNFANMGEAMKFFKRSENQHLFFEPSLLKQVFDNANT
jgi:uncharacterized protein YqeY